jgi:hypothetical protein
MSKPRVDIFDDKVGFILFDDTKKDPEDAERIADVISKSRKSWLRVVQDGKVIASYDRRVKKKEKKSCSKTSKKVCRRKNTRP